MFLDKVKKERVEAEVVQKIKTSVSVIQDERDRIGGIISKLVDDNLFSNKEIVDRVLEETTLSRNMVKGMLEEYSFNKKYPFLSEKVNIKEITKIKKFFNERELSEKERESRLRGDYEGLLQEAEIGYTENIYKHQIILDDENQNLYLECKNLVEEELGRAVKSKTELFTLILSNFYINNSK